jgi:AmmeMemoRadiSam system protein B
MEHSLEVQLPFLKHYRADVSIVPITIGHLHNGIETLQQVGADLAGAIQKRASETIVVASSDMTHYEPQEVARNKDHSAIERILALDEMGLLETVRREGISMCGYAPTFVMLVAAKKLGATSAELVAYQTSGDTTGDYGSVVGYAGVIVT